MTAQFGFCIAMGIFAVIGQTSSSMCYNITSSHEKQGRISKHTTFRREDSHLNGTEFHEERVFHEHSILTETCCSGNASDTQICICDYGWREKSCEESLLCYIASGESEKNVTANPNEQWKEFLRECQPECLGEINSTFPINRKIANTNYYLIPNNLKCNTIVATKHQTIWKIYIISGVAILIIILLVMVFATVYIVRRKQSTRHIMKNEPTELIYNDVDLRPISDTYDDVLPTIPIYDDVIVPPNHVYDEVFSVPSYDYVNVQPISIYDDVNVGSNSVYDEVNVESILDPWSRSNPRMVTIKNSSRIKKS